MARRRNLKTSTMWQVGLATAAIALLYMHRKRRQAACYKRTFVLSYQQLLARTGGKATARATAMAVAQAKKECGTKPFGIV